jgi:hypothetical protein
MPAGSIRFVCDCGDRSVTALDAHIPKQTEALFLGNGLDRLKKLFRHHDPVAVVDPIQRHLPLLNKPESDINRDAAGADLIVSPARSGNVQDCGQLPLGQTQSMAQSAETSPDSDVAAGVWEAGYVWIPLEHATRI